MAVLIAGAVIYVAYWWYLQGLPEKCSQQCIASGYKGYQYISVRGLARAFSDHWFRSRLLQRAKAPLIV